MKRPLCKLSYVLLIPAVLILSCSQPEQEIHIRKNLINVSGADYRKFLVTYQEFINSLSIEEQNGIKSFVENTPPRINKQGRTSIETTCKCLATMVTCSAEGKFSSCCICWDPKTHVGACGVYFGIADCRIEKKDNVNVKPSPPSSVTVYPIKFDGLFDFANSRNIDVTELRNALNKLEASSI